MSTSANQRKLDIVEELAQLAEHAGMSLIDLAIAFVINHPGVTAAIVGPQHHGTTRVLPPRRPYHPAHRRARPHR